MPDETYADIADRTQAYLRHHFGFAPPIQSINHQTTHLASAFSPSGFEQAMCLSYDAYGDRLSLADGFETANARAVRDTTFFLYLKEKYGMVEVHDTLTAIIKVEAALSTQ